ncbi:transport protein particle complex of the golgi, subunit bet5-like protein [Ascodesmis nigricans]|uniref:Trafficking protein particle complex subunit n=1 Tax=Ascodesmis nigricans TaxID=341454 RepID=A0A4S2N1I5_9PEZI|nr:transport protein particle complex of the golgi, subunit bet5-like protein [Ascodesmis nigricans]
MPIYSFYIFDRHCECIYTKQWHEAERYQSAAAATARRASITSAPDGVSLPQAPGRLSVQDDAKLIFGVVFSLRNMVRKLSGPDDSFISFRTNGYKLHYYETPTNLRFVMLTDTKMSNLRAALHQIYVNLYVEFVVKNPLSPVEHPGGVGVGVEMFEYGLERFIKSIEAE